MNTLSTRRIVLYAIAGFVGFFLLMGILWAAGLLFRHETAEIRGKVDAQETLEAAPSRISNYNHFFNLCASIEAHEAQIALYEEQLADLESRGMGESKEAERTRTRLIGVQGARAAAIAKYNGDAQKSYTQARFKSSDLPWRLELDRKTVCNASYNN